MSWRSAERVSQSYVSRVLRLTLLAPGVVEAILDGRQPEGMRLEELLEGFPAEWKQQVRTSVSEVQAANSNPRPQSE